MIKKIVLPLHICAMEFPISLPSVLGSWHWALAPVHNTTKFRCLDTPPPKSRLCMPLWNTQKNSRHSSNLNYILIVVPVAQTTSSSFSEHNLSENLYCLAVFGHPTSPTRWLLWPAHQLATAVQSRCSRLTMTVCSTPILVLWFHLTIR